MKRWLILPAAVLTIAVAGWLVCPRPLLEGHYPHSRAFFDNRGRLLRLVLAADDRYRLPCGLDRIAPRMIQATLLYEDKDFHHHPGVDPAALARAFWTTYITRSRRVGASTIAMQVARLRWRIRTDTWPGKLRQIMRALQLTRHYGKDRILEAYLNLAPYGGNIEGIQAASLIYFNKTADRLSLPEALTLAVVPQNPVGRNPATARGFRNLMAARQSLFARWLEAHPRDRQAGAFLDVPMAVRPISQLPFEAPHLVETILAGGGDASGDGMVTTTVDLDRQRSMQAIVHDYVTRRSADGIVNAAAIALNRRTMALAAMVGSADFFDDRIQGQVNGATARRSPGSALKPFVYALALDQGLIHPASLMKDSPRRYGGFSPENFDQRFLGPLSAHDALILSRNVPAANLQARLGAPGFHGFLQQAGIDNLKATEFYGLALALGGVEISMLELTRLYAALANGGRLQPIRMVQGPATVASSRPILSPEAAFLVLDILKDNPPPESHRVPRMATGGNQVAWKTGTSHGFRDAWAVGVCADTIVAVWVGNFSGEGNRAFVGRTAAGPLLFDLLSALVPDQGWTVSDDMSFTRLNLRQVEVCGVTGELPGKHCPSTKTSWFIPGVSPIRVCTVHRVVPVDIASGHRACRPVDGRTAMQTVEFWPTDLLAVFRLAGISLKTPPPYDPECRLDARAALGPAPVITSPQDGLSYAMQSRQAPDDAIAFQAIADGDVAQLYWFVDNRFIGASDPELPLMWPPQQGTFAVRVVDDHGRAAENRLRVELVR